MPHRKGKIYNNGVISKKIIDGDDIPEGFVLGRLPCKEISEERKREVVEKRKRTTLEKYGVDNAMKSKDVVDKLKKSNTDKYGVSCPLHANEIKEQVKKTNLERYGAEYTFQAEVVKRKIAQTNLERYGAENPFASEKIKEKIKETNLEKYGVEYPMQSKSVREKSKYTSLALYGVEYPNQSSIVREHIEQATMEHLGVRIPILSEEVREKTIRTNQERYGVDWTCQRQDKRSPGQDSKPNLEFAKLLNEYKIIYEREFSIGSYVYDFKVDNTLIEINPSITHNTLFNPFGKNNVNERYHYDKSKLAEDNGYRVIHIFDWDDRRKIIRTLLKRETIYARNCEVREIDKNYCDGYLILNHLQETCRCQDIRLGLYYKDILVSVMTFGKPRYNKNYEYELLRYCSTYNVIGGECKLFKYFVNNYKPKSIISYCDKSKFLGTVYRKIGMELKSNGEPTCHWFSYKSKRHITDNLLRQRGADQLLGTNYGKGTSNKEIMIKEGFISVYDCGQAAYIWNC